MELLEREVYLTELKAALAEARSGHGRVALVSGEAGIGKTSLIENFTRSLGSRTRVLWGACDSLFTPRPLGPLVDMTEQIRSGLPELLDSDANRATIFSAFLKELQRQPAIVVFEDVHWADEATLDLLRFIGRRITRTSALLILTYRDDELGMRHPLRLALGDLSSSAITYRILLPPLSEKAVRRLVGQRALDPSALHRQTGGNPFFVTEVLASPSGGIPPTIRDAVLARSARLSSAAREVLEVAAVIGPRIEPWLLADVSGPQASNVEECISLGILVPQSNFLAFRHELARQTILSGISPSRRIILHHQVVKALKTSPATRKDLARLAHHAEATGDYQAVLEYAPAAARQAAAAGAHREAMALYALTLHFAEALSAEQHALMLEAYAHECNVTEQLPEAISARKQALEIWTSLHNPLKQGELLASLTIPLRNYGKNQEAEQVSSAAIARLEALPPGRELALAYRTQAILRLSDRDIDAAIEWGNKAIALADRFGDFYTLAMAHIAVGSAWLFLDFGYGSNYLERRLEIAWQAEEDTYIANTYAYLGACSAELYHFHQAERYLAEGIAFTGERALDIFSSFLTAWQGLTYLHLGRWDKAMLVLDQLSLRSVSSVIGRIPALVAIGRLRTRRGDPGANQVLDEALQLAIQTGNLQHLGVVRAARAESAWLAGDVQRTRAEALASYELAVSKRHPWFTGELAYWCWRAGEKVELPAWTAKPFALQIAGEWSAAAQAWEQIGCPYEQAGALQDGDGNAQLQALKVFENLGARPAADALREQLIAAGVSSLPRKPRSSTRKNPFNLTDRQIDTLTLLVEDLSNAEIAERLNISLKTVDHHVSAILRKLGVHSRQAAASLARQLPPFNQE